MRFLRRSLTGLFLLSLTAAILALAGNMTYSAFQARWAKDAFERPRAERVFAVNVLMITSGDVVPVLTAFGEVRSQRVLDLRSAAAGTIVELTEEFVEGGTVLAGALLARIDPQNARSVLERSRADMAEAEAEVGEAARALELAKDEVTSAKAQVDLRATALVRQQSLLSRGVGTEAAVEAAALAQASAAQSVLSRRQALQQAQARITKAATQLERQTISLADAARKLADTEIHASFTGTLGSVTAVEGGLVANNERLAQLIDAAALEVSFRVSTSQYARLLNQDGGLIKAPVDVLLDVYGVDMLAQGHISRESAAVGEGMTGRLLFATLDQPRGFRPGDFVTVRIREPVLTGVVVLPASAVDAAGSVLLIADDERLEAATVEVLRKQGDDVIVRAPAIEGRQVVAERSPLLGEGIKVRPIHPEAQASGGPDMLELTDERRARLIAFVEANSRMPKEAKARVLAQLAKEKVPARTVARIEARMGG